MGAARFRYALEPVMLQRQWALDDLQRELGRYNAQLAQQHRAGAALQQELGRAADEWSALSAGQAVSVDRFALVARYLVDRRRQLQAVEQDIARVQRQRDDVIDRVTTARRALDAVEQHKDKMHGRFMQARLGSEFKAADDQWSVLQAGEDKRGD